MENKDTIRVLLEKQGRITSREAASAAGVSRQYAHIVLSGLVADGAAVKFGGTRNAFYVSPEYLRAHPDKLPRTFKKRYDNKELEEHRVLLELEEKLPQLKTLPDNVQSIFTFAFSEMLNNAIEHSDSKTISVAASVRDKLVSFEVNDTGVGVFRNIMEKKHLRSETEAIQDLLKGKMTTMPRSHSGEGIFFTSKSGDRFALDSFGHLLSIDTLADTVLMTQTAREKRGTRVVFSLATDSQRHLNNVFRRYTNIGENSDYGFDKTEIRMTLYTSGGVHISRSQARRIVHGLERFKVVVLDYENVPLVGQAFADEIYRVFQTRHPDIRIENENMSEGVQFMVERAKNEADKK